MIRPFMSENDRKFLVVMLQVIEAAGGNEPEKRRRRIRLFVLAAFGGLREWQDVILRELAMSGQLRLIMTEAQRDNLAENLEELEPSAIREELGENIPWDQLFQFILTLLTFLVEAGIFG